MCNQERDFIKAFEETSQKKKDETLEDRPIGRQNRKRATFPTPTSLPKPKKVPSLGRERSMASKATLQASFKKWKTQDGKGTDITMERVEEGVIELSKPCGDNWLNIEIHAQMGGFLFHMLGDPLPQSVTDLATESNELLLKHKNTTLGKALDIFLGEFKKRSKDILEELEKKHDEDWGEDDDEGDWGEEEETEQVSKDDLDGLTGEQRSQIREFLDYERKWDLKEAALRSKSEKKALIESKEFQTDIKGSGMRFTPKAVSLMLKKQLFALITDYKSGKDRRIEVIAVEDNIFHWNVKFRNFGFSSKIQEDLILLDSRFNRDYIEFEVKFDMFLHPFYPPEVNSVYPRLENFFVAAIVCMDELLLEKWKPVTRVMDILEKIWKMLGDHGRVSASRAINDPKKYFKGAIAYGRAEQVLCRLSQVTSIPPRTYQTLAVIQKKKSQKLHFSMGHVIKLQKQLSGEGEKGEGDDIISYFGILAQQRQKRKDIKSAFSEVVGSLMGGSLDNDFTYIVKNSALLSAIESYLDGTTIKKMVKHSKMYLSVLTVIRCVVQVNGLHALLFIPISQSGRSLADYLSTFKVKNCDSAVQYLVAYLQEAIDWRLSYYKAQFKILSSEKKKKLKDANIRSKKKMGFRSEKSESKGCSKSDKPHICPICGHKCSNWVEADKHIQMCVMSIQYLLGKSIQIKDDYSMLAKKSKKHRACALCGKVVSNIILHMPTCWTCPMCTRPCDSKSLVQHVEKCTHWYKEDQEEQANVNALRLAQTFLVPCQKTALEYVKDKARTASEKTLKLMPADLDMVN
ncbi:hypothetical protein AAMO2058_001263400, partial [Amorphochlora amoebiformis]